MDADGTRTLERGAHEIIRDGRCAMEWVTYLAGEPHSDAPACVSEVLRRFICALNDALEDAPRQRLRPYLVRTIGTSEDGLDETRSWMALDWLIRTSAPTWLNAVGQTDSASRLKALPPVTDLARLKAVTGVPRGARDEARRAWWRAIRASRFPIRVSGIAGIAAARESAWGSSGAPAWNAAAIGVRKLACDTACALCREIAGYTAATLMSDERVRVWPPSKRPVVPASIAPMIGRSQESAFARLGQMLPAMPLVDAGGADRHDRIHLRLRRDRERDRGRVRTHDTGAPS